ncbi:autotransporter domain-containing protein [Herminiimonas fonticola]|uniref:Outer membrane autotransporter protein n=1 Tax=Herminiimonas fonticola TaxID=303380 RepID=A0A4R6GK07_9BURK|nr:autotransporter domain-containing protein [Herminiimonas fonticola]RBA25682.1 outer membrane autotransporter barrel domain [Herminiimonas fonticola]TDN94790.1 outer membrane autotransporter protein [Herminiimonas fonticola]
MSVSAVLSGCGGGGGGSGGARTTSFIASDLSNADAAHARGITGAGVTVGVVDTDFNVAAPELAGRITKDVYSPASGNTPGGFIGGSGNGNPHGTEVAEALGGTNTGVAPGVRIYGIASGTTGNNLQLNTAIYDRLYNSGVRIFNQSNTVGSIATPSNSATYNNIYQPFVAKGGLFVWATGNDRSSQPSMTAGLPALYPSLQTGWLAVTAVNAVGGGQGFSSADTTPGVISSYANRCGVAANWCLAAPGDFVSPTAGRRVYGTSFAVPAVTGTLALVQQVYPWMNADLLRQTILSTATSMGDTATYGWGLLNAGKAIDGPALFAQSLALGSNVNVSFDGMSSTFRNDIGGDAGLVKSGTGNLTLSGNNTYSGNSRISNGTLNITGSVRSGVQIDAAGNLSGDGGQIGGNVSNSGRLSNTGKGLTIAGNYTGTATSILANDINSRLVVGGTAALGNSHLVATVPTGSGNATNYVTAQASNTPKTILTAGAVVNTFGDIGFQTVGTAFPPLLAAQVNYAPKEVNLTISRVSTTSVATQAFAGDATRTNTAANVEQAMLIADASAAANPNGSALLTSAAALQQTANIAALGDALDSLSGQIHASSQALTFQQSQTVNRALSDRMALLGNQNKQTTTGLWGATFGTSGKLAQSGYASGDTGMWGGQFGVDTRLGEHVIAGAALSYSDSKASFDRLGGVAKGRDVSVSVYGRYAIPATDAAGNSNAYVAGRIGAATVSSTVNRVALAGAEVENLQGEHTDRMLSAYAETGYSMKLSDNALLTPFAGISYDHLRRGAFAESGGSFGLVADSQNYRQWVGQLGVRAESDFNWFAGRSTMQTYAAWQHAMTNVKLDLQAAFAAAPGSNFTVQGIGLARNTGWSGVGISTAINRRVSWYANYDVQFGRGGLLNNLLLLGVRIKLD